MSLGDLFHLYGLFYFKVVLYRFLGTQMFFPYFPLHAQWWCVQQVKKIMICLFYTTSNKTTALQSSSKNININVFKLLYNKVLRRIFVPLQDRFTHDFWKMFPHVSSLLGTQYTGCCPCCKSGIHDFFLAQLLMLSYQNAPLLLW